MNKRKREKDMINRGDRVYEVVNDALKQVDLEKLMAEHDINSYSLKEFLELGKNAMNDIDEQFMSKASC